MSLISDGELRRQLQVRGVDVGPITETTRGVYQKKLRSLSKSNVSHAQPAPGHSNRGRPRAIAGSKRLRVEYPKVAKKNVSLPVNKKPKLDIDGHNPEPKRPPSFNLYPDLSELSNLGPSVAVSNPPVSVPSSSPQKRPHRPRVHRPNPIAMPDPPSPHPQTTSHTPSPQAISPTFSLSPPSPRIPASEASSSSPESPVSPSSKSSEGGLFQVVTKFFGKLFNNQLEPRQPLSSGKSPTKAHIPYPRSQYPANPSPSNLANIDEVSLEGGIAEATSYSGRVQTFAGPSVPEKKYDWELEATDVVLCRKPDGSYWRLGKGGFGEVYKGLRDSVDEVAVKIIRLQSSSPSMINLFKAEIDLISKLRHRNIVQFYGACIQPQNLYMVTELMSNDLFSVLRLPHEAERYKWTGVYGKDILMGVGSGLNYLHSRKPPVVHRDIKSPNILVMDNQAKIADVGVARTMAASDMTAQKGFTVAWAAPEVLFRRRATEKIDIWSFGIIIWEVVSGRLPKPGKLLLPGESPPPLKTLYSRCVSDDPGKRPGALEIVTELRKIQ